jgi:lincosamide nucleotidyltransferase A/C/D/E
MRSTLTRLHLIGIARFVDRTARRLFVVSVKFLRSISRFPVVGRILEPLLVRLDRDHHLHLDQTELLRVCRALSNQQLSYWVGGGWGLDILVGCETRRHGDLDFVLANFKVELPDVALVLAELGYQRKNPLGGTMWFPDAEVYEDDHGHHIEILNINWKLLATASSLLGSRSTPDPEIANHSEQPTEMLLAKLTSTGEVDGVSVPILSAAAQQLFHLGYERRDEDWHAENIFRLISIREEGSTELALSPQRSGSQPPSTLLLVPIFSFPPDLWRLCRLYRNDLDLMPPHVTLAFPFLPLASVTPDVVRQLSTLFSGIEAFDFELNQVRWFGTNVVYLEPSESDSFRSIIELLQREFPDFHPYNDEFESVIPHVCLSEHGSIADRRVLGRHAPEYLPISSRAAHVWLMCNDLRVDEWSIAKIFALDSK